MASECQLCFQAMIKSKAFLFASVTFIHDLGIINKLLVNLKWDSENDQIIL